MEPISDTLEIEVGFLHNMEPLFFEQAQEMAQMGLNFEDCLKALKKFGGNIERAIDEVLNQLWGNLWSISITLYNTIKT